MKKKKNVSQVESSSESNVELDVGPIRFKMKFWHIIVLILTLVIISSVGFSIKSDFFSFEKTPMKVDHLNEIKK
jgi:hypothetical protein